jgi:uncharacterized Fe-S cluster-containing MiaB family protein
MKIRERQNTVREDLLLDKYSLRQQSDINRQSLQLRTAYYHSQTEEMEKYLTPYGGAMTESIGAFPEFILRGTFCKRSSQGLCSPCFYSRFPLSKANRNEYFDMIRSQISYVTSNFKQLVIEKQFGQLSQQATTSVSLVLTPTGSFFDEFEFPIDIRLNMEQALLDVSEKNQIRINLHIESHCEDFLNYDVIDIENKKELNMLRQMNTKIIFGFESFDEYSRNVLYNKKLTLNDFQDTVAKVKENGLIPGAFVFAGLFSYNDMQTYNDVLSTVAYLLDKHVFPVIMFQNDQPYTITDVLLKNKKINLLEPYTVAWIIFDILKLICEYNNSYWLVADPIGGPPEPDCHIFNSSRLTPNQHTAEIYRALVALRKYRDIEAFMNTFNQIQEQDSFLVYKKHIESLPTSIKDAIEKTDELLNTCTEQKTSYLQKLGEKA